MLTSRRLSNFLSFLFGISISLIVSGCMVGPDYHPPFTPTPPEWSVKSSTVTTAPQQDPAQWWKVFNDPVLSTVMARVQVGNRNFRQAQARLQEARARRGLAVAGLFPTLTGKMSGAQTGSSKAAGFGATTEFFSDSLDASWEIDVAGKLRRGIEAAEASLQASEEDLRDVLVSLYAETALNYIALRSYQARISITESNLAAQQDTYQLTDWRYQAGLTTQLDADQARLTVETTRATLPPLRTGVTQAEHTLALLTGQPPGALKMLLNPVAAIPDAPVSVAIGIPAELLRQRPDIRRAERRLAAQTAQVGVAKAARYPNLNLSGSIGLEALAYTNLYTAGAKAFQIAASSAITLFDAGRIRRNIAIQSALQEQALAQYEASVLQALQEVENALIAFDQEQKRRDTLKAAVAAGQNALVLAESQYNSGTIDFLRVLDAQRSLLTVQNQLAQSEGEVASNLVRLYKALGGGWNGAT